MLTEESGEIESYRFGQTNYTGNINCAWEFQVKTNYTFAFVFDVFEIKTRLPESSEWEHPSIYNENFFLLAYFNCKSIELT